jgi:hydroxymethylbilane synthase
LDLEEFTPAVGQGSVAIEAAKTLDPILRQQIIAACNHPETEFRLKAERAYLRVLEGGCSIPVFALAKVKNDSLVLRGGIISLDGHQRIALEVSGEKTDCESLGQDLAELVFAAGGKEILDEIKKSQPNS